MNFKCPKNIMIFFLPLQTYRSRQANISPNNEHSSSRVPTCRDVAIHLFLHRRFPTSRDCHVATLLTLNMNGFPVNSHCLWVFCHSDPDLSGEESSRTASVLLEKLDSSSAGLLRMTEKNKPHIILSLRWSAWFIVPCAVWCPDKSG